MLQSANEALGRVQVPYVYTNTAIYIICIYIYIYICGPCMYIYVYMYIYIHICTNSFYTSYAQVNIYIYIHVSFIWMLIWGQIICWHCQPLLKYMQDAVWIQTLPCQRIIGFLLTLLHQIDETYQSYWETWLHFTEQNLLDFKYCWWKKSCTTQHVWWNPANNGKFTISTGERLFLNHQQ